MIKRLIRLLFCTGLLAGLLTVTALAADWTYDQANQKLTSSDSSVTLSNVTADKNNNLTIGNGTDSSLDKNFSGSLDLSGQITDGSSTGYTITAIGDNAFYWCDNLTAVELPAGLTGIGDNAFFKCTDLTSVNLSGCTGLTSIGDYAFVGCSGLTAVTLPASLTSIGEYAFADCSSLTSLALPASLTSIGEYAFTSCSGLTSLALPASLTSIGEYAFWRCTSLATITVAPGNASFSAVDNVLFDAGKTRLICYPAGKTGGSYTVPDTVTAIGDSAFVDCSGLTAVTLPASLTSIGEYAFSGCIGLTSVDLSGCTSLTSIEEYAFQYCTDLTSVDLSGCTSLTSIGDSAFFNCIGLTSVDLSGCTSLTSIGEYAFQYCTDLTSVDLSGCTSLTSIKGWAFWNCASLTELVVLAETPPSLGTDVLNGCSSLSQILVPAGSVEKYKQAAGWSTYAGSIEAPSYGLTVTPDNPSQELLQGAAPTPVTFTVTNSSNFTVPGLAVTLTDSGGNFELDASGMAASLAPSDKTTFTVTPKSGLAPGTYTATVQVTSRISNQPAEATLTCSVSQPTYTVTVSASGGGTATGGGTYTEGATVTLTATPDSGYHFAGWTFSDNVTGADASSASTTFPMPAGEVTVTAHFARNSSGGGSRPTPTISQQIIAKLKAAKDGDVVTIDLPDGKTTLDKEVFEELAGRDVTLVLNLEDEVSWSIYGLDVPETGSFADTDMGVSMNSGSVPVDIINAITGEIGTMQMTLAHDGEFGFTLTLTAPLGSKNAGYWANLYYYDEDAESLTFQVSAKIGEDGTAALRFTHASQYVIIIDDRDHTPKDFPFVDVTTGDWFYEAVDYVYQRDLMNGTDGTHFTPDGTSSRAMVATILWRMAGEPQVNYAMQFADVPVSGWYTEAVRWAASEGIVTGYSDTKFGPDDPVTREQFAVMLYRYAQTLGEGFTGSWSFPLNFPDAAEVSDYAYEALCWMTMENVIQGMEDGGLHPQSTATRAQLATMFMRFCEEYGIG